MKIAIQGHPTRGKEVIQILESLGGNNLHIMTGSTPDCAYYINSCYNIDGNPLEYVKQVYQVYTLEEFEKEFPFKIGDIVLLKGVNKPYEVIALEWYMSKLCYKLDSGLHYAPETLTTYKEMKEERNITLTLDKAKEWYKKGGELKEIALQAFTEKELTKIDLPKTWEEFYEQYEFKKTLNTCFYAINTSFSLKYVSKFEASVKLQYLRDCWRHGWEPDWSNHAQTKYCISYYRGKFKISILCETRHFLSFPTIEMAKEFLKCFGYLIEKAGDLI